MKAEAPQDELEAALAKHCTRWPTPAASRRLLAMSVTEKEFGQTVIAEAALRGYISYHTWISLHSPDGFPDFVALRGSQIVVAELKTLKRKKELTTAQRVWLVAWWRAGARVYVWTPLEAWQVSEALA